MSDKNAEMQERQSEKAAAAAEIERVLKWLGARQHELDLWERVYLTNAVAAVFSGCYGLAITEARLALTPPNDRSPEAKLPTDPIFERCDLQLLSRALNAAIAEPVRRFPHIGPVEISGEVA